MTYILVHHGSQAVDDGRVAVRGRQSEIGHGPTRDSRHRDGRIQVSVESSLSEQAH